MKELGILTKIEGRDAVASVTMGEGCSHCRSKGECSAVGAEIQVRLAEGFSPAVGDMVSIELPSGVQAAALAWIVACRSGCSWPATCSAASSRPIAARVRPPSSAWAASP